MEYNEEEFDQSEEPALDALIQLTANDNKDIRVKRTLSGRRYLHCMCSVTTPWGTFDYNTIITDATAETGDWKALRVYQPDFHDTKYPNGKNVISTVARVYSMNLKSVPSLDDEDPND